MAQVKGVYQRQLLRDCKDPKKKDDMDDDHNKILQIVTIKYTIKTIKLIFTIFIFIFLVGMLILLLTDEHDEFDTIVSDDPAIAYSTEHFWIVYGIRDHSPIHTLIVGMYYA